MPLGHIHCEKVCTDSTANTRKSHTNDFNQQNASKEMQNKEKVRETCRRPTEERGRYFSAMNTVQNEFFSERASGLNGIKCNKAFHRNVQFTSHAYLPI